MEFRYRDIDKALQFMSRARQVLIDKYEEELNKRKDISASQIEKMLDRLHKFLPAEMELIREAKKIRSELDDSSSVEEIVHILLTLDSKDLEKVEKLVYQLLSKKRSIPRFSRKVNDQ